MTTTEERKRAEDEEENKDEEDEEEAVQSIPELEQALREYTEQMIDIDQLDDGEEKEEMKRCLLYTSPSPRDQRGSRMPSSA